MNGCSRDICVVVLQDISLEVVMSSSAQLQPCKEMAFLAQWAPLMVVSHQKLLILWIILIRRYFTMEKRLMYRF